MKLANRPKVAVSETWTLTELGQFCYVDVNWMMTLVEHGALRPSGADPGSWRFSAEDMRRARQASRLAREYGLNHAAVELVLNLLQERNILARKLALLTRQ